MNVPEDLLYTESHEWVRREGDKIRVGITDHAQAELTDVVFVDLPKSDASYEKGGTIAVVESVKAASDVYSPIAGEVVAANDALTGTPEAVNDDAYAAWLFRIRPSDADALAPFMNADAYQKLTAEP